MDLERTQVQSPEDRVKSQDLSLRRTQPPAKVPGYEPDHLLGEGAYGEVWVAIERNTGRKVAVKFYTRRGGMDWTLLKREVEKLATLSADRHVIQLIEVGWESDPPYYVMEYLGHGSLEERLEDEGTLSVDESIGMFREVATGLMHAHGKSVLHCDLKPANVLLDQDSKPRLCDFGQARLSDEQTPSLGTLFYMAPEQAHLKEAVPDVRWDVYALGALFYCMLTGEPPYRTDESIEKLEAEKGLEERLEAYRELIEESPRPAEHRKVPGVDRQLADLIDHCLAPQSSKRYSNVQAVINDLDNWQHRKARRPQLVLGTVLPVLLLIVVGFFAKLGFDAAVKTTGTELNRGTDNLLKTIAHFAVGTIENRVNKRWGFLIVEAEALTQPTGAGRDSTPEDPSAAKGPRSFRRPKTTQEAIKALQSLLSRTGDDVQAKAILDKYNGFSTDLQKFDALVKESAVLYQNALKSNAAADQETEARREIEATLEIVVLEAARSFLHEYRDATKIMPLLAKLTQGEEKTATGEAIKGIEHRFRKSLQESNPQQEGPYRYYQRYKDLTPDQVVKLYALHLDVLDQLKEVAGESAGRRIDQTRGLETLDAARWWTLAKIAQELKQADKQWDQLPARQQADAINEGFKRKLTADPAYFLKFAAAVDARHAKFASGVINQWRWLPRWLAVVRAAYDPGAPSASWFLNNAHGVQLARTPIRHTLFDEWSWRDYFHGQRRERQLKRDADENPAADPITVPHLSQPFDSQATGLPIVAFSVPLKTAAAPRDAKPPKNPPPPVSGILAMTVNFGQFSELGHGNENEGVDTTLIDARPHASPHPVTQQPQYGVLLEHRYLKRLQEDADDEDEPREDKVKKYFLDKKAVAVVTELVESIDKTPLIPTLQDYQDPVGKDVEKYAGPWRAAFKAVVVRNRHTGWVVIVQQKQATVLAPVQKLEGELRNQAIVAGILVVVVLAAAWGFVILVLHGQTRSKFITTLRRRLKLTVASGTASAGSPPRAQRRTSRLSTRRENGES